MPRKIFDAQAAMGFLRSQVTHIQREVNEVSYPEFQYAQVVPIDRSVAQWAKSVTYQSMDLLGEAQWINLNSNDIPLADRILAQHEEPIHDAAIGYGYGYGELQQAIWLSEPLTAQRAKAARRAAEQKMNSMALVGDTTKNAEGFINSTVVSATSATTGTWATATPPEILKDINDALDGLGAQTLYSVVGNTILLPDTQFNDIASRLVENSGGQTVLEFVKKANVYTARTGQPLMIRTLRALAGAGVGPSDRMIAYRNDIDVVRFYMPMDHTFLPVWQSGPLNFVVPGIFRMGGVDWRRPTEAIYIDGI